jgi:hypothetical protein
VAEGSLATVPRASNADNLGGAPWWEHQRTCATGAIYAFVYVPVRPDFPTDWTQLQGFNCKGGQILARREATNTVDYYVVFQGNPAVFPLATATDGCGIARVTRQPDGSFIVRLGCDWGPFVLALI